MDDPTHTSLVPEKQETSPSACKSLEAERERVQKEKVDLVLVPVSGRCVCARVPSPEPLVSLLKLSVFLSLFRLPPPPFALPELWFNPHPEALTRGVNRHQRWLGCWCKGAVVWRGKCGEVVFIASSVLSPGGECFHSLASPALVELSGGLVFGSEIDEALCREVRKLKKIGFGGGSLVSSSGETRVSVAVLRWRLCSVTVKSRQRRRVAR
ncbi:hypothetical protein HID58_058416 [Brassica napus]|uniref:Uncharacterized protein n=1 Tax=Brassica napus TaxID=3708 RepID=A0ABQ7ZPX3_BRANA|nr:hypothetical protein HID58_058416 [Brassica napus]